METNALPPFPLNTDMAVPEELRDPSLYLTSLEMQELERVFRLVAHFEEKVRAAAAPLAGMRPPAR